jgi:hypothetical protein
MKNSKLKTLLRQYIFFNNLDVLKYPEINNIVNNVPYDIILEYCIL